MKTGRLAGLTIVSVFLALAPAAYAQESTLSGTVRDNTGGVLPGVTVTATNEAQGTTYEGGREIATEVALNASLVTPWTGLRIGGGTYVPSALGTRVLDLSPASEGQAQIACGLAEALGVRLILAHVIEPVTSRLASRVNLARVEADRRSIADDAMSALMKTMPSGLQVEALVAYGDPAEELAKVARDRQAGLIVVGVHGSPVHGLRMGSVTYRLICLCPTLVLALPPQLRDGVEVRGAAEFKASAV